MPPHLNGLPGLLYRHGLELLRLVVVVDGRDDDDQRDGDEDSGPLDPAGRPVHLPRVGVLQGHPEPDRRRVTSPPEWRN